MVNPRRDGYQKPLSRPVVPNAVSKHTDVPSQIFSIIPHQILSVLQEKN